MAIEDRRAKKYWTHGKPREKPWIYRDRANGFTVAFKTEGEAKEYQEENNSRKRRTGLGLPSTVKDLKKYTARDIVRSYANGKPSNVYLVLYSFANRDVCSKNLFDFNEQVAEQCVDAMLKETWKPRGSLSEPLTIRPTTVRWRINHIQQAWKMAKRWQGLSSLQNPWEGIRITGSTGGQRERSLEEGELEKLLEACKGCLGFNRYYLPLAMALAIETGMRRQEVLNLTWEDIRFEKRRILIRKSKTDKKTGTKGGVVVLTVMSEMLLNQLRFSLLRDGSLPGPERMQVAKPGRPEGRIFPMTGEAFTQAFGDVVKRAKVPHITFHDLRRTANMTFIRADLSAIELNIAMRHAPPKEMKMNSVYTNFPQVRQSIQDKLDKYKLGGMTSEELEKEYEEHEREYQALCRAALQAGATKEIAVDAAVAVMFEKYPKYVEIKAAIARLNETSRLPSTQARLAEEASSTPTAGS
jgi:integrase